MKEEIKLDDDDDDDDFHTYPRALRFFFLTFFFRAREQDLHWYMRGGATVDESTLMLSMSRLLPSRVIVGVLGRHTLATVRVHSGL